MFGLPWKRMRRNGIMSNGGHAASFDPSTVTGYARDWNFADITKLYTDTAGTIAVTADGDPIGAVLCSAGSTVKLSAPADASRATYETGIQNGLSVARFDGSDDYLTNLSAITADASQTIFIVAQKRSAPAAASKTVLSLNPNSQVYTNTSTMTGYGYYQKGGAVPQDIGGTPANWNIIAIKFTSNAAATCYINGGAGTSFDPFDFSSFTALAVGAASDGSNDGDYDVGRVLVYSTTLADADLNTVFSGLGALWGISVTAVS